MSLSMNLRNHDYCDNLSDRIINCRPNRKEAATVRECLQTIYTGIDMINSMEPDADEVMGVKLSKVKIRDFASDLIQPAGIYYDITTRRSINLGYKQSKVKDDDAITFNEWEDAWAFINVYLGVDENYNMVNVDTLRVKKNLSDVIGKAALIINAKGEKPKFKVNYSDGESYYPVFIDQVILKKLFDTRYFLTDLDLMLGDHYRSKSFK